MGNDKIQLLFSFFDAKTIIDYSSPFRKCPMAPEQILWVHTHYPVGENTLIAWIKNALENKENYYKKLLKANSHNHISRPILNQLLLEACRLNNKNFFEDLCCIDGMPANADEISQALNKYPAVDICNVASRNYSLDQHVFDFLVEELLKADKASNAMELLQSSLNGPSQTGLQRWLRIAARKNDSGLFVHLYSIPTPNKPSSAELSQLLVQASVSGNFFLEIYKVIPLLDELIIQSLIKLTGSPENKELFPKICAAHRLKPFSSNTIASLRTELKKNSPHLLDQLPFVKDEQLSPLQAVSIFKPTPANVDSAINLIPKNACT